MFDKYCCGFRWTCHICVCILFSSFGNKDTCAVCSHCDNVLLFFCVLYRGSTCTLLPDTNNNIMIDIFASMFHDACLP